MRLALSLALIATLTTALFAIGAMTPDTAQAQDQPIRRLPVKPRPKLKKVTPTPRPPTPNLLPSGGRCHAVIKERAAQEGQYKMKCTNAATRHKAKVFRCSGGRIFTHNNETRYRQWGCASDQVSPATRYVLGAPTGNDPSKHIKAGQAADNACGCLPNVQESCSSGECRATLP